MTLTNAELIAIQIERELESKRLAKHHAAQNDERLKAKRQNSKTLGGLALHRRIMADAVSLMAEDLNYYFHGTQGSHMPSAYQLLLDNQRVSPYIEPEEMAHIALMTLLDSVHEKNIPTISLTKVFMTIGRCIEDQAKMNFIQAVDPNLFERVAKYYLKKSDTYSKKMSKASAEIDYMQMDNPELDWKSWSPEEYVAVGSWAAWIIQQTTQWFQEVTLPPSKTDPFGTTKYLVLSREGLKEWKNLEKLALERSYANDPMVVPPLPWAIGQRGGYYLPAPGGLSKMIHGFDVETVPSQKAIDFLNNLQSQKYRVNAFILDILKTLLKSNHSIGKFQSMGKGRRPDIIDPDIWGLPDTDERKKDAFIKIMKERSTEDKKQAQALGPKSVIQTALEMASWESDYYMPWFFDTRLRAYPLSNFHTQGTDWHKALQTMAYGSEITRENFEDSKYIYGIALANTWGNKVDKRSFAERVAWAEQHVADNIETVLAEPLSKASMDIWTTADEPFQHLALLKEYHDCILNWKPGTLAHVPIGFDATCSGLQLLGSFVKDPETCRLVNVLPSDRPQDAYAVVAQKARDILSDPDRWTQLRGREEDTEHGIPIDKIDRSVAKKVVMLIPYGGSYDTLVAHVRSATESWKLSLRDVNTLTKALIQGMDEAVPGFSALNRWFKEAAAEAMMRGNDRLTWTTPTGSTIVQRYMISSTKLIRTIAFGVSTFKDKSHYSSNRLTVFDDNGPKEVHKKKNKTALAANWTHSMDASVLQEAFHDFDEPFTTVHDCLYTTAPAMKAALKRLRQAFVTVTTYDALNQFVEDNELEINLPPIGDADVSSALASEYLFS